MTREKHTVKLKTIAEAINMEPVYKSSRYDEIELEVADINRPALQLAGFYDYFNPKRIQIIGRVESTYLESIGDEKRQKAFDMFFSYDIPCFVVCHGCVIFPECLEAAKKYDRTLFIHPDNTADVEAMVLNELQHQMAPRITTHGVLVEIYGEGVLLTGDSGIGKSETALELIKRGHRLIADDAVEIKQIGRNTLVGNAPKLIQYYMELRGIGVINVRRIYGVGAVKPETDVNLVVALEHWDESKAYDRLGLSNETETILGVTIPKVTIPVRPGRNLAVILELAAMNNRQKKMGYNAAEELAKEVDANIDGY